MATGDARRKRKGGRRRAALAAWLLCSILAGSIGAYEFAREAREAKAATEFSIKTGYYNGTGAAFSITGLGFTPEVVLVRYEGNQYVSGPWMKTTAMPASVTANIGAYYIPDNTESQITLNADGFTLSAASVVNLNNGRFIYVAFAGSDCTSGGSMCVGSYTGTGASSRAVSTGFQPNLVWTRRANDTAGGTAVSMFRTSAMSTNHAAYMGYGQLNETTGLIFQTLDSNGFTVGATNNAVNAVHYFVAFKTLAGKLSVGSFVGNGADNRDITGVGFEPDFVLVKQDNTNYPVMNITESFGDLSTHFGFGTPSATANHIQGLQSDGFQVGSSVNVNQNGVTSHYFAFGGAPDPDPTGSFQMQRGSYIGNGTAQTIDLTFRPDLVIIKGDTAQGAVWTTSIQNDRTMFFDGNAPFTNGITAMGAASFSVGSHATVNSNLVNFEFIAFGNATTPHRGNGAADFTIGTYTGNGISGRVIDHLGFTPALLATTYIITNGWTSWKTSSPTMAANTTAFLVNSADSTDGTYLQALTSDGFTLGNNSYTNTVNAYNYVWFAFADSAGFSIGSYTGNGAAGTNITGLGFDPDWVWVKATTSAAGIHRSTSASITGQNSQYFTALANATNRITGFVTDGFTVGNASEVNASGGSYRFAAWKRTTSANPPDTPTNVAPAPAATGQDLNPTLASAYNDTNGDPQVAAQWQVDDDSDFSSPEWSRTSVAGEVTTSVTAGNGTFANDLALRTELNHDTTYYWRVRYSDGVYSGWSSATAFTTNTLATPTAVSPTAGATVTTLTPTLTASAFSDAQSGHTAQSAQWQVNTSTSFTSPLYDSGAVAYAASHAVAAGFLSDLTMYYWRVRQQDSSGNWTAYSTAARFATDVSVLSVTGLLSSPVVDQGDTVKIDAQVALTNGTAVNDASVTINIYNPSGAKVVDAASMSYLTGSSGKYRYSYTVPSASGSYLYEVTAVDDGVTGYGAGNFEVRTIQADVTDIAADVTAHEAAQAAERAAQAAERAAQAAERASQTTSRTEVSEIKSDVTTVKSNVATLVSEVGAGNISAIKTKTDTIAWDDITGLVTTSGQMKDKTDTIAWTDVTAIKTKTDTIAWTDITGINTKTDTITWSDIASVKATVEETNANVDILVGAFIITQGTVNDASASTIAFVSSLTNSTNDFYKNAVLTFTSGALNGQNRRISGYDGTSKAITLDPALTSAPANGDTFTIVTQNVRVEEQVVSHEASEASFRADVTSRLTTIESKIDTLTDTLNTVDANLDAVQSTINSVRTSQQRNTEVVLSDVSEIQAGTTYRTSLTVQDYESNPVAPAAAPTVSVYDATGVLVQGPEAMTLVSTGVYSYEAAIAAGAVSGLWRTTASVDLGGASPVVRNDYWQVTGAPAQVMINAISDATVPTIAAAVTITNEGEGAYEYQYEWCVVASEDNPCGGDDDVSYASAAKLIGAGADFSTTLNATVPATGAYYFKLIVYYGTEASGASRSFAATVETETPAPDPAPNGGGSGPYAPTAGNDAYAEILVARYDLGVISRKLDMVLDMLGLSTPQVKQILDVGEETTNSLKDIQNKMADLRAVSSATRQVVERRAAEPVVQTYMTFNSVVINFLITNPTGVAQTTKFKAFLPQEVKPEYVLDASGLTVDYDANAQMYFVAGDVTLGPSETVMRKVELKDVWLFAPEELASMKEQAALMAPALAHTQYEAQGIILAGNISATLDAVLRKQDGSYSSPQDHIVVYRDNKDRVAQARAELEKMKDLVVQAGASRGVVGQVGGIQTFATWGIILTVVFGFSLLSSVIFSMWRRQTVLAAVAMGMNKEEAVTLIDRPKRARVNIAPRPAPKTARRRKSKSRGAARDRPSSA